jgi:hypothetical protein
MQAGHLSILSLRHTKSTALVHGSLALSFGYSSVRAAQQHIHLTRGQQQVHWYGLHKFLRSSWMSWASWASISSSLNHLGSNLPIFYVPAPTSSSPRRESHGLEDGVIRPQSHTFYYMTIIYTL